MRKSARRLLGCAVLGIGVMVAVASAQPGGGFPGGGKGGPGGGFGPPGGQVRKILADFDKNKDGWLNADERKEARETAKKGGRPGGFGPKGGFGKGGPETKPGPKVDPKDVTNHPTAKLYDPTVLRTLFLEFENKDWESELEDFHGTDVDVVCNLTVDGKTYKNAGVHFRGMSSYMGVRAGAKRSLNVSLDTADAKQRLYGSKTLNLLNAHEDPTFLSTALYSHVANQYIPAPKANIVKVVINGESWGVYTSVQQFDKEFLKENFKTDKGTRWKVRGSPGGGGGLEYLGDDPAAYKRRYEIKSKDDPKAWEALIKFCKVLNTTPADKLEAELRPICDVDGLLWFLALDCGLINCDGYWIRASDYSIYLDDKGKFHMVPHDMNEAFRTPQGPGMGGPGGPGGFRVFGPPGTILPGPVTDQLRLTEEQRKALAALQKEADEQLEKLMTEEQRKQWKEMKDRFPGGPGGPGGGFPGGPGGGFPGGPGGGFPGGAGGPGGGMGVMGGGFALDPLVGLNDSRKPLRSKVLVVPALREQYLKNIRTLAEKSLDWKNLGPVVASYRKLIEKDVEADTRKLESYEAFVRTTADSPPAGGVRGRGETALRTFADERRKALLENPEVKKLPK